MPLIFRKQPSGGRGEYELVGEAGGISSVDLMGHGFIWETPWGLRDTDVVLGDQGGKRRLRLTAKVPHVQRQAAAMVLLPKSTRDERGVSDGKPIILENRYILDIAVAVTAVVAGMVTVRPAAFITRSGPASDESHRADIDAKERFSLLESVWRRVESLPQAVAGKVIAHRELLINNSTVGFAAEQAVHSVVKELIEIDAPAYIPGADPLPALALLAGLTVAVDLPAPPEAPVDLPAIRMRLESEYRLARARGASHVAFKKAVQAAYGYRCAFCGMRALDVPGFARSGVDAAHILPWGQFDLDVVQNGLLLCKQDHWAFDSHVLLLRYNSGTYRVELNSRHSSTITDQHTLAALNRAVGEIPELRLPKPSARPNPEYIERLYEGLEDY